LAQDGDALSVPPSPLPSSLVADAHDDAETLALAEVQADGDADRHSVGVGETEALADAPALEERLAHALAVEEPDAHPEGDAGPLKGTHQPAAVVDLAVLGKQQTLGPGGGQAGEFALQSASVEGKAPGGGGITIPFFGAAEGHHDAAGP
jgi:hypothetical protein